MAKAILRILAVVIAIVAIGMWAATGAHRGWSKDKIRVQETDEVTGITVDRFKPGFVPGVDFLAGAVVACGLLAGASFFFGRKPIQPDQPKQQT